MSLSKLPIAIVVAATCANGIGRNGAIPWQLSGDMARFRALTAGGVVIMGRLTYESIPPQFRPLKGRINIVVTAASASQYPAGVIVAADFDSAYAAASGMDREIFAIGGSRIYKCAMEHPACNRIYLTRVLQPQFECDVYMPAIGSEWSVVDESTTTAEGAVVYEYITYCRLASDATAPADAADAPVDDSTTPDAADAPADAADAPANDSTTPAADVADAATDCEKNDDPDTCTQAAPADD